VGDDRDWCPLWAQWYETGGAEGEEPPDDIKQLFEWWEKWQETLDVEWGKNILRSQAENLWTIGVVGMAPQPIIAKNNLRNIPEKGAWVWDELWFYPYHPEQFFLKQE
jgi:peptide/nickel transport system substrate-binding protein